MAKVYRWRWAIMRNSYQWEWENHRDRVILGMIRRQMRDTALAYARARGWL